MKKCGLLLVLFTVTLASFGQVNPSEKKSDNPELYPEKTAEDLWGNRIDLGKALNSQTVTIVPFSSSNCGYCLINGYYSEQNYILANEKQEEWHAGDGENMRTRVVKLKVRDIVRLINSRIR